MDTQLGSPSTSTAKPAASPALAVAWEVRVAHHGLAIRFDRPALTLPVSLTGTHCALNCKHCGGHYLAHMHAIDDPRTSEMKSCLISGGCDPNGRVPVESQLTAVARLHAHLRLNWHVGMIAEDTMRAIAPYVDVVSFDVVGDAETTREVYGLDLDLEDYLIELAMLQRYARVVPHVTIGLRGGRLSGEDCALDALAAAPLDALILNVLIPTPGTSYAECSPPPLEQVARLFVKTRLLMPTARLVLGCMRPLGQYRQALDALAVRAGLNGIVNPTQRAQRVAAELGLQVTWEQECCAF